MHFSALQSTHNIAFLVIFFAYMRACTGWSLVPTWAWWWLCVCADGTPPTQQCWGCLLGLGCNVRIMYLNLIWLKSLASWNAWSPVMVRMLPACSAERFWDHTESTGFSFALCYWDQIVSRSLCWVFVAVSVALLLCLFPPSWLGNQCGL